MKPTWQEFFDHWCMAHAAPGDGMSDVDILRSNVSASGYCAAAKDQFNQGAPDSVIEALLDRAMMEPSC